MNRIFREKQTDNYTIIPNGIFKSGLSLKAIGLLSYILHLPPDWVIYKTQLYKAMENDGRQSIESAWNELVKAGFIFTKTQYAGNGNLPIVNYYVYDSRQKTAENKHVENKHPEIRQPKTRQRKTQQLISTDELSTNEPSTKKQSTKKEQPPAGAGSPKNPVKDTEVEKQPTMYQKFIEIYDGWFKKLHDDVPPQYNNGNGTAAKSIIVYFKSIASQRAKKDGLTLDDAGIEGKALESWQFVLNNWHKLDNFLQGKTRLLDINSNIQNIITQLKNGHNKTKQPTGGDVTGASLASKINAAYTADGRR